MRDVLEDGPEGGKGKWGDPKVPKRGWTCVGTEDLGDLLEICEMCGRKEIRYVQYMSHPDYAGELGCGCVCAGHMEGNESAARDRETTMRNRAARRRNWPKLKAWHFSRAGNRTIEKDGCRVTVYEKRGGYQISAGRVGATPRFGRRIYETRQAAVLASFDAFMWARDRS
ncbi:hypothetical protein ACQKQD_32075 [Methylobacterium sp. NPDC080182]|uniref:hypothetical protein n=1 Tax=Methylobacterium sp. NPDC080182 TaxID=3390590 RepID=UPI003D02C6C3